MAAVATFLKGTVSESLKALVQPVGLVPAALFVLLNLAFIYPAARERGGVAKTFSDLKEEWQIVVIALMIFALGYLLLNAANAVTDTLAGETWSGSPLHLVLVRWQQWRRSRLERPWTEAPAPGSAQEYLRSYELKTRFPPVEYVRPTRLGNALAASQHVLYDRFGIDMAAFWGPMEASVKAKDAPALKGVKDEKATLDLLANLVLVLVAFGLGGLVFFAAIDQWGNALASLLALVAAYIGYRIAVLTAYRWGETVAVVFDLHREDLKTELRLSESDPSAEKALWLRANQLYTPGAPAPDEKVTATVIAPAVIDVKAVSSAIVDDVMGEGDRVTLRFIDYVFIVSRTTRQGWASADFIVKDPRVARIDELPDDVDDGAAQATADRLTYQDRAHVRWRVRGLRAGGALTISYRLPLWSLDLAGVAPRPTIHPRAPDFEPYLELAFPPGASGRRVALKLETFAPENGWPEVKIRDSTYPFYRSSVTENRYETDAIEVATTADFWRLFLPQP